MSFDKDLVASQHAAMAAEFKRKGYAGNLGPVTGPLGRSVMDGRLFEGFGNDPYLNGKLFASAIIALQSNGVVSTGKHFLGRCIPLPNYASCAYQRNQVTSKRRTEHTAIQQRVQT
jgi:beta-glucosidase-like glycosyl hydrolase